MDEFSGVVLRHGGTAGAGLGDLSRHRLADSVNMEYRDKSDDFIVVHVNVANPNANRSRVRRTASSYSRIPARARPSAFPA
jgi:hypothetical protein